MDSMMAFSLFFIIIILLQGMNSLNITSSSPRHQHALLLGDVVDFYCTTDAAISQCQYNMWDSFYDHELASVIDISSLSDEWRNVSVGYEKFQAKIHDTDLAAGHCGVSVRGFVCCRYQAGLRVRAEHGDWIYHYSTVSASSGQDNATDLSIQPDDDVFVPPGTDVTITCVTSQDGGCWFSSYFTGLTEWNRNQPTCGASYHVTEENSHMIWCRDGEYNAIGTSVSATKPPTSPPLLLLSDSKSKYKVGDVMTATCTVMESRPPANITWYLDNDVIVDDAEAVVPERWRWSWQEESRTQILKRTLTADDDRKILTCEVTHFAMLNPLRVSVSLNVEDIVPPIQEATP